jgi:hypothetical protein
MDEPVHHPVVPEFICEYKHHPRLPNGERYTARLYGIAQGTGIWGGWLVFFPDSGGRMRRTDLQTEQRSRQFLARWARAVTPTYLMGALAQAHPFREAVNTASPSANVSA